MNGQARITPHASSKAAVLDVIRAAGTISRVGLITTTGLTGATISVAVRKLLDEGLVLETGLQQPEAIALYLSSGYEPVPGFGYYCGSELSRTFGRRIRSSD